MLKKAFLTHLFLSLILFCKAQTIQKIEYFFDEDPGMGNGLNIPFTASAEINKLPFSANLSELAPGLHNFFVRVQDADGRWSLTSNRPFAYQTVSVDSKIINIEYYIDTDPGAGNGKSISFTPSGKVSKLSFSADISGLEAGLHNIFVRGQDSEGNWSIVSNRPFLHEKAVMYTKIVYMEYFIDNDPGFHNGVKIAHNPSPALTDHSFNVDLTDLSSGSHNLFVRTLDDSGNWSITSIASFEKLIITNNIGLVTLDEDIEVFPNPSASIFNIESKSQEKLLEILVLDHTGKVVSEADPKGFISSVNLTDKPAGTYFIKVILKEKTVYKKVIKQ